MSKKTIIKPIAALLLVSFLFQDIVWANPDIANRAYSLQIPLMTKEPSAEGLISFHLRGLLDSFGWNLEKLKYPIIKRLPENGPRIIFNFTGGAEVSCSIASIGAKYTATVSPNDRNVIVRKLDDTETAQPSPAPAAAYSNMPKGPGMIGMGADLNRRYGSQQGSFPTTASRPIPYSREKLYREEPIDNDLFITIFDYKARLYVKISERIELDKKIRHLKRRLEREPRRADYLRGRINNLEIRRRDAAGDICAIAEEAKKEIEAIAQRPTPTRKRQQNIPLAKTPGFVGDVENKFNKVVSLIDAGRDFKAFGLVKNVLNMIAKQESLLIERRLNRSYRVRRIKLPGWRKVNGTTKTDNLKHQRTGFRILQRFYPRDGRKYRHPEYARSSLVLFWQAYESLDRGIDYEIGEEMITIPGIRKRISKVREYIKAAQERLKSEEEPILPGLEERDERVVLRKRTARRFIKILYQYIEELKLSPVKSKILAAMEIRTAAQLLGLGLPERAARVLKDADKFLEIRAEEAGAIRKSLVSGRLEDLRRITGRRNKELKELARDIKAAIEQGKGHVYNRPFITRRKGRLIEISDAAEAIGHSYWMNEPEFAMVRGAAFGMAKGIKDATEASKEHAKSFADFIIGKCDDALALAQFMKHYRDLYLGFRLSGAGNYESRVQAFLTAYADFEAGGQDFGSRENLTRGSPGFYKYFALFFIPVFIPTKGKKKPTFKEPITNPLFQAAQTLLRIIEARDFQYLIGSKHHLKGATNEVLTSFNGKKIFTGLSVSEKREIILALAKDYNLDENSVNLLKQMARLRKINLLSPPAQPGKSNQVRNDRLSLPPGPGMIAMGADLKKGVPLGNVPERTEAQKPKRKYARLFDKVLDLLTAMKDLAKADSALKELIEWQKQWERGREPLMVDGNQNNPIDIIIGHYDQQELRVLKPEIERFLNSLPLHWLKKHRYVFKNDFAMKIMTPAKHHRNGKTFTGFYGYNRRIINHALHQIERAKTMTIPGNFTENSAGLSAEEVKEIEELINNQALLFTSAYKILDRLLTISEGSVRGVISHYLHERFAMYAIVAINFGSLADLFAKNGNEPKKAEYVRKAAEFIRKAEANEDGKGNSVSANAVSAPVVSASEQDVALLFLQDMKDPERLIRNMLGAIFSIQQSGKKLVLAFHDDLKGFETGQWHTLLRKLEALKSEPLFEKMLKDLVIIPSFDTQEDLVKNLQDRGIDASDAKRNLICEFAPKAEREKIGSTKPAMRAIFIDEKKGFDPTLYYYPLFEIVTITLTRYLNEKDFEDKTHNIKDVIKKFDSELGELNIESVNEDTGVLVFTLIPKAERYDTNNRADRYALLMRFIDAAA